jgi:hypothetical protein
VDDVPAGAVDVEADEAAAAYRRSDRRIITL